MTQVDKAFKSLGRRGSLLAVFGATSLLFGISFFTAPPYRFGHLGPVIGHLLNSHWLGWAWVLCGLVAIVVAFLPRRKSDTIGFVALLVPNFAWTCLYTISWALSVFTHDYGESRAWVSALTYLAKAAAVFIAASWADIGDERE